MVYVQNWQELRGKKYTKMENWNFVHESIKCFNIFNLHQNIKPNQRALQFTTQQVAQHFYILCDYNCESTDSTNNFDHDYSAIGNMDF